MRTLDLIFKQHLNPLLVLAQTIENRRNVIFRFETESDPKKRISTEKINELRKNMHFFENELIEHIQEYRNSKNGFPIMTTEEKIKIGLIDPEDSDSRCGCGCSGGYSSHLDMIVDP